MRLLVSTGPPRSSWSRDGLDVYGCDKTGGFPMLWGCLILIFGAHACDSLATQFTMTSTGAWDIFQWSKLT